jgi:type II secretory pathway pseudopilin PulG
MISNALKFLAGFGIVAVVIAAVAWIWRMAQKDAKKADVEAAIQRGDIEPVKTTTGTQGTFLGKARGLRNNNPGNVEILVNGEKWKGQTGEDGNFAVFEDMEHGARAMIRMLKTYGKRYGIDTVKGIISHYPPILQDEIPKYSEAVSKVIKIDNNARLTNNAQDTYTKIAWAIANCATGVCIPYEVFESGAKLEI